MKKFLVTIIIYLQLVTLFAQSDTVVYHDLRLDWKTIDSDGKPTNTGLAESEFIIFNLPSDVEGYLRLKSDNLSDVWINDQLAISQFFGTRLLSLDSIRANHGAQPRVSVYQKNEEIDLQSEIVQIRGQNILWKPNSRQLDRHGQYFVMLIIIMVLIGGLFMRISPSIYSGFFKLLRIQGTSDVTSDLANNESLLRNIFLAFLLSVIFYYLNPNLFVDAAESFLGTLIVWICNGLIISFFLFGKHILTLGISKLFGFKLAPFVQINGQTSLLIISSSICLLLLALDFTSFHLIGSIASKLAIACVFLSVLMLQGWTFLKLDKLFGGRKLMIFSYLCTTEMAPGFLALYWLGKLG
ncbi:MAG: hypothetical protein ACI83W_000226 [Marinoscillum sp.]